MLYRKKGEKNTQHTYKNRMKDGLGINGDDQTKFVGVLMMMKKGEKQSALEVCEAFDEGSIETKMILFGG
jgi:hypothetical protein